MHPAGFGPGPEPLSPTVAGTARSIYDPTAVTHVIPLSRCLSYCPDVCPTVHERPMYTLISATPSPYARKVRIALIEKGIPFELQTEVPWDSTTSTPRYNPLEKLPVLICPDGSSVYESRFILEYLELVHPMPALVPSDLEGLLAAKRLEVLCDGVCDALVLMFFEKQRGPGTESREWTARQLRKVNGGIAEMARLVGNRSFAVGDSFSLGDIAAATATGYMSVRWPTINWRAQYPGLARHNDRMDLRPAFAQSRPVPQRIADKVV
jgi:glutathione S-transferase